MIRNSDNRTIIHFDLDTFFVSVERLKNSKLIGLPVLIGGLSDRGVVASCSYEARIFGVHSAMPMKHARRLCPKAIIISGDMENYSKYSRMVSDVIANKAPLYEKASIDEHYIDISGMDRFFGSLKWSQELRQSIIQNTGLPISFGLSINKTVAKIATGEAKPNGELEVKRINVPSFLAPLSIRKIPMIGKKTFQQLHSMGISTVKDLQNISLEKLERTLGKNGKMIWKKANGIDNRAVAPYTERKSISAERTLEKDSFDIVMLKQKLVSLVEKLTFQLRKQQKLTACITIKIRYSNFDTFTQQKHIPYTAFDHILLNQVKEMFDKLYNHQKLIRLIGVKFSHLVHGSQQLNMFENSEEMVDLYQAMDKVRIRFGEKYLKRAVGIRTKIESESIHKDRNTKLKKL